LCVPRGVFEWLVVSVGVAVVTINVAVAAMRLGDSDTSQEHRVKTAVKALPALPAEAPAAPRARARPPAPANIFAVTATRGDSWLAIRSGSERGRLLYEDTLEQGATLRLRSTRLWIRFGAAANVDLRVNGEPMVLPLFGTFDAFVDASTIQPDPTIYG
jgi:hypothetical protein